MLRHLETCAAIQAAIEERNGWSVGEFPGTNISSLPQDTTYSGCVSHTR